MNTQLSAFIAVSCLAHAGALLWSGHHAPARVDIGGQAQALQVTVARTSTPQRPPREATDQTPRATAPAPKAQHAATLPRRMFSHARRRRAVSDTARNASGKVESSMRTAAMAPPATRHSSSLKVSERVSAALQSRLAESFEYPWLARKRGWQGLVTLSLHIAPDGMLSQWKVARTSGHSLLDRSALRAAKRITRLPQADRLLNGRSLTLSIPVRYQLVDS